MPSGASPRLGSWLSLNITLGALGIHKIRLLPVLIPYSIKSLPKTLKLHNTKLNRKSYEIPQYKKINLYYKCCIKPIHILFLHYIYCTPTFLWQKLIKENHRAIKISTQHKENRICQNRTVCSNLSLANTSVTQKILKNQEDQGNLFINLLQKESGQKHFMIKMRIIFVSVKFLSFSARPNNYHPRRSYRFCLAQTLIKT